MRSPAALIYNYPFTEVNTMAVKIRLRRMGAKKAPFYRVVVADSRYPRDGDSLRRSVTTILQRSLLL